MHGFRISRIISQCFRPRTRSIRIDQYMETLWASKLSQINAQLLYNLHLASGSTTYTGSQPSQNEREIENQHLYSSQTHQNLSGRQELLIPDQNLYGRQRLQIPDTSFSSFNPPAGELMPGVVIPTAQRNQKSGNDRPYGLANGPMTYSGSQPLQNRR